MGLKNRTGPAAGLGSAILLLAAVALWKPQAAAQTDTILVPSAQNPPAPAQPGQVVRAIDDPFTGGYWLLERDPDHPGGPGRLVRVSRTAAANEASAEAEGAKPSGAAPDRLRLPAAPVIRAGQRLVVEENTAVVEARLEAVALGPAAPGAAFEARLQIGGRVVRAVALGPGRAAFANQIGARP
jgi:hypothetical protein